MSSKEDDYKRAIYEAMATKAARGPFAVEYTMTFDGSVRQTYGRESPEQQLYRERQQAIAERDSARSELKARDEFIKQLGETAFMVGVVASLAGDRATVRIGSMTVDSKVPQSGCKVGDHVRMVQPSNQILSVIDGAPRVGATGTVTFVATDGTAEVNASGQSRSVVVAAHVGELKPGDSVVIDETGYFAMARGAGEAAALQFEASTGVTWDDVGGLHEAKEAIREAIEYPIRFAELYKSYGKAPSKGVLLYGPPGGGKTMLGKAAATAIREAHGSLYPGAFLYVKGPELLNKYVGATEDAVRGLFDKARRYKAKTGHAAVLFIDEADALLGRRDGRSLGGMESTVVPAFLAEMDGLEDSGAFVMLSTNRPDSLDSAIVRDGRIDRRILVGRPDHGAALSILRLHLRGRLLADTEDPVELARATVHAMFSDDVVVFDAGMIETTPVQLLFRHVVSGAVIAGVVNRATERALRRDRDMGGEASGITTDDMRAAVHAAARELSSTDIRHELLEVAVAAVGPHAAKKISAAEVN